MDVLDMKARLAVFEALQTPDVKLAIGFILSCDRNSRLYAQAVLALYLRQRVQGLGIEDAMQQASDTDAVPALKEALKSIANEQDQILLNLQWIIATALVCDEPLPVILDEMQGIKECSEDKAGKTKKVKRRGRRRAIPGLLLTLGLSGWLGDCAGMGLAQAPPLEPPPISELPPVLIPIDGRPIFLTCRAAPEAPPGTVPPSEAVAQPSPEPTAPPEAIVQPSPAPEAPPEAVVQPSPEPPPEAVLPNRQWIPGDRPFPPLQFPVPPGS